MKSKYFFADGIALVTYAWVYTPICQFLAVQPWTPGVLGLFFIGCGLVIVGLQAAIRA